MHRKKIILNQTNFIKISKAITLAKTCESTTEMRECRSPRDWSLLALQNTRTGKSHYLVICRCPDNFILGKHFFFSKLSLVTSLLTSIYLYRGTDGPRPAHIRQCSRHPGIWHDVREAGRWNIYETKNTTGTKTRSVQQ